MKSKVTVSQTSELFIAPQGSFGPNALIEARAQYITEFRRKPTILRIGKIQIRQLKRMAKLWGTQFHLDGTIFGMTFEPVAEKGYWAVGRIDTYSGLLRSEPVKDKNAALQPLEHKIDDFFGVKICMNCFAIGEDSLEDDKCERSPLGPRPGSDLKRDVLGVIERADDASRLVTGLADAKYIAHQEALITGFTALLTSHLQAERETHKVTGETSDGHHTFNELYDFRMAYNALLFNEWAAQGKYDVHLSYKHHDGEPCFGKQDYFVVVASTPEGQISNHYKGKYRHLFHVPERACAAEWDGHTPQQALERMLQLASQKEIER